ncbi:MAG: amino acid ABC transporter permease, partial [Actinomycetota bacterium]
LGFFVPAGFPKPGVVTRALIAITLFSAAYAAEVVRGGLQAVPRGQIEAAQALGLSPFRVMGFVVLPQALRSVIPAMVGHFISLFKDTSLVGIIGLVDFLRIGEIVTAQADFRAQGLQAEVFLFVSFVFWVGAYWMSRQSQRLEQRLGVGER